MAANQTCKNTFSLHYKELGRKSIYPRKTCELPRKLPTNGPTYLKVTKNYAEIDKSPPNYPQKSAQLQEYIFF